MGWLALALIGAAAAALLWLLGVAPRLWAFVGAGLMIGATGYAWQGQPGLPGHPVEAESERGGKVDDGAIRLRGDILGNYTADTQYLVASDALLRAGDRQGAVKVLLFGIDRVPNSYGLWTALGGAYAEHDGTVSPAARFAFAQAMRLAPDHPAPPFFYGLALIRAGDFAAARPFWARALKLTPATLSYRPDLAERLRVLDLYLAAVKAQPG